MKQSDGDIAETEQKHENTGCKCARKYALYLDGANLTTPAGVEDEIWG